MTNAEKQRAFATRRKARIAYLEAEVVRLRQAVGAPPDAKTTPAAPEPPRPAHLRLARSQATTEDEWMEWVLQQLWRIEARLKGVEAEHLLRRNGGFASMLIGMGIHPDNWDGMNKRLLRQQRDQDAG